MGEYTSHLLSDDAEIELEEDHGVKLLEANTETSQP
jgi:hypothetical protein